MARPRHHDAALRNELLSQATTMIGERGLANLTLRQLALAGGTSTSAVYSLFGSKEELIAALTTRAFEGFTAAQRDAVGSGSAATDLPALGRAYRAWAKANPLLFQVMFAAPTPDGVEATRAIEPLQQAVAELVRSGAVRADARAMVTGLWALVHGFVTLELGGLVPDDADALYEQILTASAIGWVALRS
jgi:AcrR family transcriptional regulator